MGVHCLDHPDVFIDVYVSNLSSCILYVQFIRRQLYLNIPVLGGDLGSLLTSISKIFLNSVCIGTSKKHIITYLQNFGPLGVDSTWLCHGK